MKLRLRLVFALAAVSVPLVAGLVWFRGTLDYRAEVDAIHRFLLGRMEDGRAACEADPERFPHPPRRRRPGPRGEGRPEPGFSGRPNQPQASGPMLELFAYGPDFISANQHAPAFPAKLKQALEDGAKRADERISEGERSGIRVAARMPWGKGPCAIVLVTRAGLGPYWLNRNQWIAAVALVFGMTLAVFVAAGPIVTRIRRLTAEVRQSSQSRYATPVTVSGKDEISELAHEFNRAGQVVQKQWQAVEARAEALRAFVANTTHDVMIPMTVLQGHLSALRAADGPPDPKLLHDAMAETQYVTSLLQNLGASAKLEAGELVVEDGLVDLNALVDRVVARHAPIAKQKRMELNSAVPEKVVAVNGDLTLLEQAVSNLVHNAVRYGVEGGHVALLLDGEGEGGWRLRVIDDGPGIEESKIVALLQRSQRGVQARRRHPEGQGLGLHIAQEVARRHNLGFHLRPSEYGGLEAELAGEGGG
ncbi:MAG: sensor histidine kinase [Planctomycetota bacterium]|nr:MAG: sensor histidine kinase [Planctomycetota bacterium]